MSSIPLWKPLRDSSGKYANPWDTYEKRSLGHVVKWMWNKQRAPPPTQEELDKNLPVVPMNWDAIRNPANDKIQCTWIGHASFLIQMDGVNILTDPVWSEVCSPISFVGPKRQRPTPCQLSELPKIDMVVISHNHYDHLDYETVRTLGDGPTWFVPEGNKTLLESMGATRVIELSWWDQFVFSNLTIVCTPCQHWSKRTAFDDFKALWSSWSIIGSKKFFFTGDTAYCAGFTQIGEVHGPFDLAAIPIGAYEPRWFMKPQHINPEEAVQIHQDIQSKKSVGMHWGTFILTDEPLFDPPIKLKEAMQAKSLPNDEFLVLNIGETKLV